jgi:N-acetylglucosamine-6-phosphate deacetylase
MVTLAPELPRALELIRQLVAQEVVVALGHSAADVDTARSAIDAGARYGTHLFNAMSGLDHHAPGLAAALLGDERATVGVIADGIHVHPELIRLAYRLAGPERFSLVSDAIAGLGMPPGTYPLGSRETIVSDTAATLADGTLAGSVLRLNRAVSNLVAFTGCTLESAVEAVTLVPARLLRIDQRRGSIRPGAMADLALLTKSLDVVATFVAGEIAYATERVPRWD